jgi:hypothetical protein
MLETAQKAVYTEHPYASGSRQLSQSRFASYPLNPRI